MVPSEAAITAVALAAVVAESTVAALVAVVAGFTVAVSEAAVDAVADIADSLGAPGAAWIEILLVGACLQCHVEGEERLKNVFSDFAGYQKRLSRKCWLPEWAPAGKNG